MYAELLVQEWRQETQTGPAESADGYPLPDEGRRVRGAATAARAMQAARDPSSGDLDSFRHMGFQTRRLHAVS